MWVGDVDVDGNGIVLFDPLVVARWRPNLAEGADLFTLLVTTDAGDEALEAGVFVPILAIDDGGYRVVVRSPDEPPGIDGQLVVENGTFPLAVARDVVVADLAVLRHWLPEVGWTRIPLAPGSYGVTVRGMRRMSPDGKRLDEMGYELVAKPEPHLPPVTGETGRNMRTMNWWDAK
jgi:hypothetical protein